MRSCSSYRLLKMPLFPYPPKARGAVGFQWKDQLPPPSWILTGCSGYRPPLPYRLPSVCQKCLNSNLLLNAISHFSSSFLVYSFLRPYTFPLKVSCKKQMSVWKKNSEEAFLFKILANLTFIPQDHFHEQKVWMELQ